MSQIVSQRSGSHGAPHERIMTTTSGMRPRPVRLLNFHLTLRHDLRIHELEAGRSDAGESSSGDSPAPASLHRVSVCADCGGGVSPM